MSGHSGIVTLLLVSPGVKVRSWFAVVKSMPGLQGLGPPSAVPVSVVLTFTVTVPPVEPPRMTVTVTPVLLSFTLYIALENRTLLNRTVPAPSLSWIRSTAVLWAPIVAGALTLRSLSVSVSGSRLSTTLSTHS